MQIAIYPLVARNMNAYQQLYVGSFFTFVFYSTFPVCHLFSPSHLPLVWVFILFLGILATKISQGLVKVVKGNAVAIILNAPSLPMAGIASFHDGSAYT